MRSKSAEGKARDDRDSLSKWTAERQEAAAAYVATLNRRENDLLTLSEENGPRSVARQTADQEQQKAQGQYTQIHSAIRHRPLNKLHVRWRFFAAFALALALLEAPVNKYLFDVALQGSNIVSYSVSIAVAFALLVLSHVAGKCLRQVWSEYRRRLIWSNLFIFLAATAVVAVVICILTVGRWSTAADTALSGFDDIFSAVSSTIGSQGLWRTLVAAFSNVPALILATVNVGGGFVAFLLAYFSHDPDKDFDLAAIALDRGQESVARLQRAFQHRRRKIIRSYEPDLSGLSGRHAAANRHVTELKTKLSLPLKKRTKRLSTRATAWRKTATTQRKLAFEPSRRVLFHFRKRAGKWPAVGCRIVAPPRPDMRASALLVLAASFISDGHAQPIEDRRFCAESATNVVLFLDVTTPYDEADRHTLISGMEQIFDSLGDGDRISIRTIEDNFASSDRLLDMCMPFCPSNGFFGDWFSECTAGVVIQEKKKLRAATKLVLRNRLEAATELPHSEIIRTLAEAIPEEVRQGRANRVYVFSDMIENSEYLSGAEFFGSSNAKIVDRLADDKLIPDMTNARVVAFGIGRGGGGARAGLTQERLAKLHEFWELFFVGAGAKAQLQMNFTLPD